MEMFDLMIKQNNRFHSMINSYEDKLTAAQVSSLVSKFLIPNTLVKLLEFNICIVIIKKTINEIITVVKFTTKINFRSKNWIKKFKRCHSMPVLWENM